MKERTFDEINEKIKSGTVVVCTAEELIALIGEVGLEVAYEKVDVVTTGTFGPMCSSGAFLNFGHSDPPIRMEKIMLNSVEAYGGLAAVDTYIGATAESEDRGYEYGGAHVICDLIDGKEIVLEAHGKGTDCYPARSVRTHLTLSDLNEAYLYNPRNAYQNYSAATNTSVKALHTYMGTLLPKTGNVTYSTSGEISPLLKDPSLRTIGVGTRLLVGGAVGYVAWNGTQCKTSAPKSENGTPLVPGATLAVVGELREMDTRYINPAVFKGYGTSLNVGIGIPIPVIDMDVLKACAVTNKEITTNIVDYSVQSRSKPVIKTVTYEELQSGKVEIGGKEVKTSPTSSIIKAREIAENLKKLIEDGEFLLEEPVKYFRKDASVKAMKDPEEVRR